MEDLIQLLNIFTLVFYRLSLNHLSYQDCRRLEVVLLDANYLMKVFWLSFPMVLKSIKNTTKKKLDFKKESYENFKEIIFKIFKYFIYRNVRTSLGKLLTLHVMDNNNT